MPELDRFHAGIRRRAAAVANALTTPFLIHAVSPAAMLAVMMLALVGAARLANGDATTNARAAVAPDSSSLEREALGAALGGVSSDELTKSVVRLDFALQPTYTPTPTPTRKPRPTPTPVPVHVEAPAPAAEPPASQPQPAAQRRAAPRPQPASGGCGAAMGGRALALFNAQNRERTSRGLAPLAAHGCATRVAQLRATDMARRNYFSHTSPDGQGAFSLLDSFGVRYRYAGENIARNSYPGGQAVTIALQDFMASPGHRDNILSTNYTHVGVGVGVSGNVTYFAIVFLSN
jgi:uncharacterized protein YkwD